jgi:hypothetical protein
MPDNFGNATHGQPLIEIPDCYPQAVAARIREIEKWPALTNEDHALLGRLADRMKAGWQFIAKRNRAGKFVLPARIVAGETQDEAQQNAMERIFRAAFLTAVEQPRVWRESDLESARKWYFNMADILDQKAFNADAMAWRMGEPGINAYKNGERNAAKELFKEVHKFWNEANQYRKDASEIRAIVRTGRPIVVRRYRSYVDGVAKAYQIVIASQLKDIFGKSMDDFAAKITSWALDKKTSRTVSRSQRLQKRKPVVLRKR